MLRRLVALATLTAALAAPARAQAPAAADARPQPGSVSGRVTMGGKPAAGVFVRLPNADFDPEQKRPLAATTDAEGKYEFSSVAPGRYFVSPYVPGASGPNLGWGYAGAHVSVAPGEDVKGVDVALERGGAVTGRVTDGEGRPLIEQPVYLLAADAAGKKQAIQVPNMQFMMTDDRGVYRIYGVAPGRYFVAVGKLDQQLLMMPTELGRDYPLTYYPGTTNEAEAKEVTVASGGEAGGVNIAVGAHGATYAATGRVVVPEGGAAPTSYWVVYGTHGEGEKNFLPTRQGGAISATGEFRIEGLAPGTYGAMVIAQPGTGASGYSDVATFRVTDSDVAGVDIQLHRGASLSGVLAMEEGTDPGVRDKISRFQLLATVAPSAAAAEEGVTTPMPGMSDVAQDGSFTLSGLKPGSVKVYLNDFNAPKGFSILRIEREGVPIQNGFEIGPDETISGLRVVIGFGTGVIRGQVTFKNGSPPKNHQLFILASRVGGTTVARGFRVDERGQFVVEGLAPGDYEVALRLVPDPPVKLFAFKPDATATASVANGGSASVTITVDMSAVELEEVKP